MKMVRKHSNNFNMIFIYRQKFKQSFMDMGKQINSNLFKLVEYSTMNYMTCEEKKEN